MGMKPQKTTEIHLRQEIRSRREENGHRNDRRHGVKHVFGIHLTFHCIHTKYLDTYHGTRALEGQKELQEELLDK